MSEEPSCRKVVEKFYDGLNGSVELRVYVYAANLVGRKKGRKEIVMELRRNFSSYLPE